MPSCLKLLKNLPNYDLNYISLLFYVFLIAFLFLKGFVWKISTKPYISIFLLFNILLGVLVWLCSCLILLSGDVEVNPGPKNSVSECLSTCHWNLNDISAKTITNYFIWRHIYRFSNWYYLFLRNISQFYCYPWWWELSNFRI